MPLNRYYKGDGREVMRQMVGRYGGRKGRSVFYATANKRGMTPKHTSSQARRAALRRRLKRKKHRHG